MCPRASGFGTPFHVVYGVAGQFQQGLIVGGNMMITGGAFAARTLSTHHLDGGANFDRSLCRQRAAGARSAPVSPAPAQRRVERLLVGNSEN